MEKVILTKVNGQGFVKDRNGNATIPRKVLERNAMDCLTCWEEEYSFDDCLDFVETATTQTLLDFLKEYHFSDDTFAVVDKYMSQL